MPRTALTTLGSAALLLGACLDAREGTLVGAHANVATVSVTVSPISDWAGATPCFDVRVTNAHGEVLSQAGTPGAGDARCLGAADGPSFAFEGTCDPASDAGPNVATIWYEGLAPRETWVLNPCPPDGPGCQIPFACHADAHNVARLRLALLVVPDGAPDNVSGLFEFGGVSCQTKAICVDGIIPSLRPLPDTYDPQSVSIAARCTPKLGYAMQMAMSPMRVDCPGWPTTILPLGIATRPPPEPGGFVAGWSEDPNRNDIVAAYGWRTEPADCRGACKHLSFQAGLDFTWGWTGCVLSFDLSAGLVSISTESLPPADARYPILRFTVPLTFGQGDEVVSCSEGPLRLDPTVTYSTLRAPGTAPPTDESLCAEILPSGAFTSHCGAVP